MRSRLDFDGIRTRVRAGFFHARDQLLRAHGEFFSTGLRLPEGAWLSVLSGWHRHRVTYVDLQMNDMHYKKESISAVMRAFLLEHEIALAQESINFVGGSSLLLRRYCEPPEPCTDIFIGKASLRARFFEMVATRVQSGSVYERLKPGAAAQCLAGITNSAPGATLYVSEKLRWLIPRLSRPRESI